MRPDDPGRPPNDKAPGLSDPGAEMSNDTTNDVRLDQSLDRAAAVRAEIREIIRQVRAAQAALEAERQLQPLTSCPCGCSSRSDYTDPDCLRHVRDHAAAYRAKVDRQRAVECRSLSERSTHGVVLCLLAGNAVEFVAELFGITVDEAQLVRDAIPERMWDEREDE